MRDRAAVIQQKTGWPVPFEITDASRDALSVWLALRGKRADGAVRRTATRLRFGAHRPTPSGF